MKGSEIRTLIEIKVHRRYAQMTHCNLPPRFKFVCICICTAQHNITMYVDSMYKKKETNQAVSSWSLSHTARTWLRLYKKPYVLTSIGTLFHSLKLYDDDRYQAISKEQRLFSVYSTFLSRVIDQRKWPVVCDKKWKSQRGKGNKFLTSENGP